MADATFQEGKEYTISSEFESIILTSSYGDVTGRVVTASTTTVALNGATISIKETGTGEVVKRGNTSNGGYFTVKDCPTGTYDITIEMTGYVTYQSTVSIGNGSTTDLREIQLQPTEGWFGLDLAHTLMIIGGAIAVILILFGAYLLYRTRKGKVILVRNRQ